MAFPPKKKVPPPGDRGSTNTASDGASDSPAPVPASSTSTASSMSSSTSGSDSASSDSDGSPLAQWAKAKRGG
jgi:hypothetical protein